MTWRPSLDEQAYHRATALLRRRNLRDLGGLPTRSLDLVVRPGRFFRSSTLSRFDPDEQRALRSLNLRSVVDLRMADEVAQSAPSLFSAEVRLIHVPLFEVARENWVAAADQSPGATAGRYFEMVEDGLPALAAVVEQVALPDATPFVVSCVAGRDRTGIVVACLLDLLDVDEEAIATDYALSDSFEPKSGRAHAATIPELLTLIRDRYGSTERMLASHGVAGAVIEALRTELLGQPR